MIATPLQFSPGGAYIAVRVWDKLSPRSSGFSPRSRSS